ncbi:metallophosphoesterase family protein [Bacillus sp. B-jedd]|uniref:metallophosphoesterase family protein n=1 Tax=Bacillus sp. B-jedd TaxID=1476857 RepID=UPI000515634C|nr:metallophosphoesterase family protein [Bacillus sp. B-jedd]CEG27511.1 phosphodiesterase [Bacillus sp. B-jedd]
MKIIVLSDTHMPKKAKELPSCLIQDLKTADLIIHAGDWQDSSVFSMLSDFARVEGVHGNVDDEEMKNMFPAKKIIQAGSFSIGIVHGHGTGKTTERRAFETFLGDQVDCIIYGHSHIPVMKYSEGILLFNPGSPTDKRRQQHYSYGVIDASGAKLDAKHIYF